MKSGKPASLGRNSRAKVVLPVPFGPAMMTILGDSGVLFMHAYYSPETAPETVSPGQHCREKVPDTLGFPLAFGE